MKLGRAEQHWWESFKQPRGFHSGRSVWWSKMMSVNKMSNPSLHKSDTSVRLHSSQLITLHWCAKLPGHPGVTCDPPNTHNARAQRCKRRQKVTKNCSSGRDIVWHITTHVPPHCLIHCLSLVTHSSIRTQPKSRLKLIKIKIEPCFLLRK